MNSRRRMLFLTVLPTTRKEIVCSLPGSCGRNCSRLKWFARAWLTSAARASTSVCPDTKIEQHISRHARFLARKGEIFIEFTFLHRGKVSGSPSIVTSIYGGKKINCSKQAWRVEKSERRWSEPVPGREFHPPESSGFHGALLRQLPSGTPLARHLSTDPVSSDLTMPDGSEQKAGNPDCNGRAVMWYIEFGFLESGAWHPATPKL